MASISTTTSRQATHPIYVLAWTVPVFGLFAAFLYGIDFVPEPQRTVASVSAPAPAASFTDESAVPEVPMSRIPTRVRIASIGVDTRVTTPASADVAVLDRALLLGAVHYPGSGDLGRNGNVLIFGHSSYLPVVKNKAFQAFNELGKLTPGAEIEVVSDTHTFRYRVTNVRMAKAEQTLIPFDSQKPLLTLASCNTFGAKEDRYVVTAEQIEAVPLGLPESNPS